jgi:ABC-type uncharacterized transport system fused permease/ATPase subunit
MIAIVTAFVAASVVTIFTAVELDRLNAMQQKADTVAKLGLIASKKVKENIQLTTGTDQVDPGSCGLIGPVVGKH